MKIQYVKIYKTAHTLCPICDEPGNKCECSWEDQKSYLGIN